jgi:Asp-tRNA(Asn)/Glu-tRNA(Gln) amidotransferase B subunit
LVAYGKRIAKIPLLSRKNYFYISKKKKTQNVQSKTSKKINGLNVEKMTSNEKKNIFILFKMSY